MEDCPPPHSQCLYLPWFISHWPLTAAEEAGKPKPLAVCVSALNRARCLLVKQRGRMTITQQLSLWTVVLHNSRSTELVDVINSLKSERRLFLFLQNAAFLANICILIYGLQKTIMYIIYLLLRAMNRSKYFVVIIRGWNELRKA